MKKTNKPQKPAENENEDLATTQAPTPRNDTRKISHGVISSEINKKEKMRFGSDTHDGDISKDEDSKGPSDESEVA